MYWLVPTADSVAVAVFLLLSLSASGTLNAFWLRHSMSKKFTGPIDGGRTFRGKRVFGDNKTFRGFMVIVPFTGLAFLAFSLLRPVLPDWFGESMWPLTGMQYLFLGFWAGLAFMLGELPNSFVKRQLDIAPGEAPSGYCMRLVLFVIDHVDSILACLIALTVFVTIPAASWVYLLVFGSIVHLGFSAALYALDVKKRLA